jgi:hypothetical protein
LGNEKNKDPGKTSWSSVYRATALLEREKNREGGYVVENRLASRQGREGI